MSVFHNSGKSGSIGTSLLSEPISLHFWVGNHNAATGGAERMYTVQVDKNQNILKITLKDNFNKSDGERCISEIVSAVNRLRRGFDVITDISAFKGSEKKCEDFFLASCKLMKRRGANHIVRVVGASKEALVKFAMETKLIDNYPVKYVPTLKDAEKLLKFYG